MRGSRFLLYAVVLAALDVLVPYLVLRDVPRFTGSFLFWCVITFVVILFGVFATRSWGRKR